MQAEGPRTGDSLIKSLTALLPIQIPVDLVCYLPSQFVQTLHYSGVKEFSRLRKKKSSIRLLQKEIVVFFMCMAKVKQLHSFSRGHE